MKVFRFIGFILITVLLCLSACSSGSDELVEPSPKPEVTKSEITIDSSIISNGLSFSNAGGDQSISFTTTENWTLSVANTTSGTIWCTASSTSGTKGSVSVKFTVIENTDYENRSVSVTIKSGTTIKTFTISQKGTDALLVTADKYEVGQEGGQIEIEVQANIDYQMEISEAAKNWITESSTRALTTYKHKLNIAMNEDLEKREGEITFKSGDKSETVKVYQVGGAIILLSQDEYTVSDTGETISVEIKSNVEFGVQMPDVDWINGEASSRGMSSHTLKYVVAPNEGYDNRSAEIIFYDKNSDLKDTLKVVQVQKGAIVVPEKNISVAKEGGTVEVKVNTNLDFEVQIPSEVTWISQTDSRALTEKSVYLKVAENTGEESRSATITIIEKDGQVCETVEICQVGIVKAGYENGIVSIATAGTMKELLGNDYLNITSLKVVGYINGDDIYYLRKMLSASSFGPNNKGKLTHLDLSEANIVEGGGWYYSESSSSTNNEFYTSNNVIGDYMFYGCTNLQMIVLPNSITSIGSRAFFHCQALTSVDIPDNVISLGDYSFYNNLNLKTVTIGNGVTVIGSDVFRACYALTAVTIGEGITQIGSRAFGDCRALDSVYITNLSSWFNITFEDNESNPLSNGVKLYLNDEEITELVIPEDVIEIKKLAFYGYSSLTSLTISNGVVSMGATAFSHCKALSTIKIGKGLTSIGNHAFRNCDALTTIVIPDNVTSIGTSAFSECDALASVTLSNSITLIEEYAFSDCPALTSVTLPDSLTSIGKEAFCSTSLTSITLPNNIQTIGEKAFYGCRVTTLTIPSSIQTIESGAFCGCLELTDVYIYATTPPTGADNFDCGTATEGSYGNYYPIKVRVKNLHVPIRCSQIYRSSGWTNSFVYINEMD